MKLLVDTDVFCKLGIASLLDDAARIFGASLQECGRLPALPFMLRRGRPRKLFGDLACDALIPVADSMLEVPQPGDIWLEKLTAIEAIDPGEAQIFAMAAEQGQRFLSGDKRALNALKEVDAFIPALDGRVVVMEAVLLALCDRIGPEQIRQRVAPLIAVDRTVAVCFSRENPNPIEALTSFFEDIKTKLAPLQLWNPRSGG